jgi:hypothetical protein
MDQKVLGVVNQSSKIPPAHIYTDPNNIPGSGLCWHAQNAKIVAQIIDHEGCVLCKLCEKIARENGYKW